VTGIYPAREEPIAGVTGELIVNAASGRLHYVEQIERLKDALMVQLRPGDVCVFMGAGNIDSIAYDVLSALRGDA
jgi:UDP-N-acetylmuramate--alanine ligase